MSIGYSYSNAIFFNGTVDAGGSPTTYAVEYSTDSNFSSYATTAASTIEIPSGINKGDGGVWGGMPVSGLQPQTTYYARLVASNTLGTVRSPATAATTVAATNPPRFDTWGIAFPDTLAGSSAYPLWTTIYNGSALVTALENVWVDPPFYIASYRCPGYTNCSISVGFAPTAAGYFTGTLHALAEGTPITLPVTGTGRVAAFLKLTVLDSIDSVRWLGSTQSAHVLVSNIGIAPMEIGITSTSNLTATSDCPAEIVPGNSCTVAVTFFAATVGYSWGRIAVSSNALNGTEYYGFAANVIDLSLTPARPTRGARLSEVKLSPPVSSALTPVPATVAIPIFAVPEAPAADCTTEAAKSTEDRAAYRAPRFRRPCAVQTEEAVFPAKD